MNTHKVRLNIESDEEVEEEEEEEGEPGEMQGTLINLIFLHYRNDRTERKLFRICPIVLRSIFPLRIMRRAK